MKIVSLGHSAFLLEMDNDDGETIRILGDPWIGDYVIGDLMARFPRLRFDWENTPEIHGLFLSHAHTDHLDPYSLLELWKNLPNRPIILLPQSIEYLQPMLEEYLEGVTCLVLEENEPTDLYGLSVTTLFNLERKPTNEDDVMALVVESSSEVFFNEADALLPFHDIDARRAISAYLGDDGEGIETVAFLTTKNELNATMASLHASDLDDRAALVAAAEDHLANEISELYTALPSDVPDPWMNSSLVRLIGGQGIAFPTEVDEDWNRVLFPIRVADRVALERETVEELDLEHSVAEFRPGFVHHLVDGELESRTDCSWLRLLDDEDDREFDGELELFDPFPVAPLQDEERNYEEQERKIVQALNARFLPWLIGRRNPPVEHLLASNGGIYVVRIRYGAVEDGEDRDYAIDFRRLQFHVVDHQGRADEYYWANDLDDLLEGIVDEFSTFCRQHLSGTARRFWDSLGLPFLNNDLTEKKLRFHFERARSGESLEDWVLPFYDALESEDDDDSDD